MLSLKATDVNNMDTSPPNNEQPAQFERRHHMDLYGNSGLLVDYINEYAAIDAVLREAKRAKGIVGSELF